MAKTDLLDKLTAAGAKGVLLTEARREVSNQSIDAMVRKGVIVVGWGRPVGDKGDKGVERVWLRAHAPAMP
jgi:hypothetical protein